MQLLQSASVDARIALMREACRRHFWMFFLYAFGARAYCAANPQDNWVNLRLHAELCAWIDMHIKDWERSRAAGIRVPKKLLMCIPRGYGKSTIGSALDCWLQVRNPELSEKISSYDEDSAKSFLGVARAVFEGRSAYGYFKDLFGVWGGAEAVDDINRRWRTTEIVHNRRQHLALRDYSMSVASVSTGITGNRPDVFRLDDPTVQEKLVKETNWIQKTRDHLDSAEFAVKTNGLTIVMLTRYTEDDVGGKILNEEGVASLTGLALDGVKHGGPWHVFYLAARDRKGNPTLPQVWPDERLREMERKNPAFYASQLMNSPSDSTAIPFHAKDLAPIRVKRDDVPGNLLISLHCDTAFKDAERRNRGDWNVIQTWGHEYGTGRVYYLNGWADDTSDARSFTTRLVMILKQLYHSASYPFIVTADASPGRDGLYPAFLTDALAGAGLPPVNFVELRRGGRGKNNDEHRVRTAVYAWKSGKVRLVIGAPDVEVLEYEMTHIGTSAKNDRRDAACDVFHPEVYVPMASTTASGGPSGSAPRPYDELMWTPSTAWTADERRLVYDADEEEEPWTPWVE